MPLLLLLSFASGCAALIYELVWFQLLQLVIGASPLSLAALLASFMGGMAVGSALLPRLVSARRHPLRVYACLELGIAASGFALPLLLPSVQRVYIAAIGHGYGAVLARAAAASACLLLPTILMGATLPAIARWNGLRERPSGLGLIYAANTAGAVCGALTASFYVLRVYDTQVATFAAVAINLVVAALAMGLAQVSRHEISEEPARAEASHLDPASTSPRGSARAASAIRVVSALSGFTALGAEVVWTRQLSLLLGATVYAFSLILAIYLLGIGIGGFAGAVWARTRSPQRALGWCQALLVIAIAYGARTIVDGLPWLQPTAHRFTAIRASLPLGFAWDALRCSLAMLPATLLWGASFSLALAAAGASRRGDAGRHASGIYSANTLGALAGALVFTLLVIPDMGTERAQELLIAVAALAGALMFRLDARGSTTLARPGSRRLRYSVGLLLVFLLAGFGVVPPVPSHLIALGRNVESWSTIRRFLHVAEGVTSSVAVTEIAGGAMQFHIAGKVEASNMDIDMRLERMLGHIPALIHGHPRSILVVGFGGGVTAGAFVVQPGIERIVICEIEPAVPAASGASFAKENHHLLDDPRTTVIYDDARHFLETSSETFDIITSDPIHPWVRGAATLYSTEYLELVKQHLNPGGVVAEWVPLYETDEASVKSEIATFARAFPDTTLWNSDLFEDGYDLVALGRTRATPIDVDAMQRTLDGNPALQQSLAEITLKSAAWLMGTYAGRARDLQPWLRGAQINGERSLRLQYLAGLALNQDQSGTIFGDIWGFRRYPADLFVASPAVEAAMKKGYEP